MELSKVLEESEDFESTEDSIFEKHYEDDGPILVVNTGLSSNLATFYIRIDERNYTLTTKNVENIEELREFMRDGEQFVVQLVNKYEV